MYLNTNIMAMNAYRRYSKNVAMLSKSIMRLSSGYRINSVADDPAGLAISEKMRAQIRGLNMASRNCQDAISLIQTAEGSMQSSHNILQRMRELAVQASSDTNENDIDRDALNKEFIELAKELDEISSQTQYNDQNLLDGSWNKKSIQTGPNQGDELTFSIDSVGLKALGLRGFDLSDRESASEAITAVDNAINRLSSQRANLGALHNRLEFKISNLETMAENLTAAESRIRDVDYAKEIMEFTRYQILTQVSMAIMAQANALPHTVLKLFENL